MFRRVICLSILFVICVIYLHQPEWYCQDGGCGSEMSQLSIEETGRQHTARSAGNGVTTKILFPYALQQAIDKHLLSTHHSYDMKQGGTVTFNCDNDVSQMVLTKFPMSIYRWMFNSKMLKLDKSRMTENGHYLHIKKVNRTDDGIYVCKLEYAPKRYKTVGIFSMVVDTGKVDYTLDIKADFKQSCPSLVFGLLFPKAIRLWNFNGKPSGRISIAPAKSTSKDKFAPLDKNMTGRWTCIVFDALSKRSWAVSSFYLNVTDPPPFENQVMELKEKNPVVFYLLITTPALLVVVFIIVLCYKASAKEKYMKMPAVQGTGSKTDKQVLEQAIVDSEDSDRG